MVTGTTSLRPMRTLVVSDLHLGSRRAARTCCAAPTCARRCSRRSRGVDRLVILGDGLELREAAAPRRGRARRRRSSPTLGAALGPGRRARACSPATTTTGSSRAGSTARLQTEPPGFLGLEQRDRAGARPARSPQRLAERAAPARVARRLPRHLAARRRLRDPRPLRRPARHRPDLRAPRRRRDGALGRASCPSTARPPDDYEAVARAALRVDARAHPARRPHGA